VPNNGHVSAATNPIQNYQKMAKNNFFQKKKMKGEEK
jgi:hypothetical protein